MRTAIRAAPEAAVGAAALLGGVLGVVAWSLELPLEPVAAVAGLVTHVVACRLGHVGPAGQALHAACEAWNAGWHVVARTAIA